MTPASAFPTCAYCGNDADFEVEIEDLPTGATSGLYVCERHAARVAARVAAYVQRVGVERVNLPDLMRAVSMQAPGRSPC